MTPKGEEKIFGITVTALSVPEQGAIGCVYTFEDHTELRRLENEVRMRDRLAAVGRLAAGVCPVTFPPLASFLGSFPVFLPFPALPLSQGPPSRCLPLALDRLV